MKSFLHLLSFTWPYRLRFGLSLGCAAVVALLWFTELGAVYPLLQILFNSQNCQKWVGDKIDDLDYQARAQDARLGELAFLEGLDPDPAKASAAFRERLEAAKRDLKAATEAVDLIKTEDAERLLALDGKGPLLADVPPSLKQARGEESIAQARVDELVLGSKWLTAHDRSGGARRRAIVARDQADAVWYRGVLERSQPWVNRYLPREGFSTLVLLLALVMVGVAVKGLFLFCQEVLVAQIMQRTLFDIRNRFFRRTMNLDLACFSDQGSAELMARFTNDMDSLAQGFNTLLSKVMREPLRVVTCLGGALWLNWRLTLLALVLVPVSVATSYHAGKTMKRAVRKSLESMSNIYKILQECFQGVKVVKAFTMEGYERRRFFNETRALLRKSVRVAMIDALSDPVLELIALSMVSTALLAGSYLVLNRTMFLEFGWLKIQLASSEMRIEDLLTFYTMLGGVSDPIRKLSNVHSKIQRAAAASDRIVALMDRTPTVAQRPAAPRLPRHRQAIDFEGVVFGYNRRETILRGIDLTVRHGETVALVGPNGCGKSTLLSLLPRFYDADEGSVRVDGQDVRDVQLRSLRVQIGLVSQETILFDGTLAENIAYGSIGAGRLQIEAAARRSYAHQFITALPDGYETRIGSGGIGLSGGQRQRIALARAMLRDPAILLLDEATSAVDIQDEALIRKAIEEFSRGRTTLLITHSLGSLQFADRIVLMNAGRVEAVGTDAELRRQSSLYRRLYEIHFQRESA